MSTKRLQLLLGLIYLGTVAVTCHDEGELRVIHKLVGGHLTIAGNGQEAELITSSAGEGRDSKKKKPNEDEKKTLSQQVADGKYGLIQTELFSKPVKRPGIISYKGNSEVPKDNVNNLGGLNKNDIWLSENHLLVLKGGTYPPYSDHPNAQDTSTWPPIDNYRAPQRQVKIPKHPKVPPPFPVQLTNNGPLLLLGTNSTTTLNGTIGPQLFPLYPTENFIPEDGSPYPYPANFTSGQAAFPVPPFSPANLGEYNATIDGYLPPEGFLPPLDNITDQYDEDDPSIYYPPPYSFYYPKDNSSKVPAGPLVPGIVLPPPPDFFAPLDDNSTQKNTTRRPLTTTTAKTVKYVYAITTSPATSTKDDRIIFTNINSANNSESVEKNEIKRGRTPSGNQNVSRTKEAAVTVLRPVTNKSPFKYNEAPGNRNKNRTIISTTQVPLKAYYTTTYKLDSILITKKPNLSGRRPVAKPVYSTKSPAQYYFYEENGPSTPKPQVLPGRPPNYFSVPKGYYIQTPQVNRYAQSTAAPNRDQNIQYYFINGENLDNNVQVQQAVRTTRKPDTFSIHIARLRDQIHTRQIVQPNKNYYVNTQPQPISKPVYEYSFEAANYQNQGAGYQIQGPIYTNRAPNYPNRSPNYPNQAPNYPNQAPIYQNQAYLNQAPIYPPERENSAPNYPNLQYLPGPIRTPSKHYQVEIQEAVEVTPPSPSVYYQNTATENPASRDQIKPKPISQYSFEVTPDPIYQQVYTKQDEKYFDDVTKQHFTLFGKKLPIATTPLPSLERDTIVNHLRPSPPINTQAEYGGTVTQNDYGSIQPIPPQPYGNQDGAKQVYGNQDGAKQQPSGSFRFLERANEGNEQRSPPYVAYKLPGDDGTHFYFITPQLAQKRQQNSSFYFSRPSTSRSRRNVRAQ